MEFLCLVFFQEGNFEALRDPDFYNFLDKIGSCYPLALERLVLTHKPSDPVTAEQINLALEMFGNRPFKSMCPSPSPDQVEQLTRHLGYLRQCYRKNRDKLKFTFTFIPNNGTYELHDPQSLV
jgi:hypothetical protein